MGWVDKRHECDLPFTVFDRSLAPMGAIFECDHCKREWQVCGRIGEHNARLQFRLLEYRPNLQVYRRG